MLISPIQRLQAAHKDKYPLLLVLEDVRGTIIASNPQLSPFSIIASSYDLSNIIAAVATISGQWKELGSGLGLQPVILDAIQGPPEVCMMEVIKHWIHGAMAASRQRLSSALERMGRTDLAEAVIAGLECGKEQHGTLKHWSLRHHWIL